MNLRHVLLFCTAFVIGGIVLTGLLNTSGTGEEKTPMADSWLVKGRQINIETTTERVLLYRKVDYEAASQVADCIAQGLDGVERVKNDLEVITPSTREAVGEKDELITELIEAEIAKDRDLKNSDISVQANAGVVSLTGEVRDILTSAQASWTAWQVPGVQSVNNVLTVKEKA